MRLVRIASRSSSEPRRTLRPAQTPMEAPPRRPRKPWDTPSNALERITSTGMGILQRQAHHMIHIGVIADHAVVIDDIFEAVAEIGSASCRERVCKYV